MPIWADPARGERVRLLADDDKNLLGMFVAPPSVRPTAADLRAVPGTDLAHFAALAVRDLPGVRATTRLDEAAALMAAGATLERTLVHLVRRGLQDDPPPLRWAGPHLAAGLEMVAVELVEVADLAAAQRLAYGDGHPDRQAVREAQEAGQLHALLAGEVLGPVAADVSAAVVDRDGRVMACLVATEWAGIGEEWTGGPWVAEVFSVPDAPLLLGRSLLARAVTVCSLAGAEAVGLTVSATNPAYRLVTRLGFAETFFRVSLDLPGGWPGAT